MPRFRVKEIRAHEVNYLVEAEDEDKARRLEGDILDTVTDADDWSERIVEVEQVDDDETEALR